MKNSIEIDSRGTRDGQIGSVHLIALTVSYNGAGYHGWQYQSATLPTVQATLESALSKVAAEPIRVKCAGRTDAGVHATHQVVTFETRARRPDKAWVLGTNALLPDDIAVVSANPVPPEFDARFSAVSRRYVYVIYNHRVRTPLLPTLIAQEPRPLDARRMHESAQSLLGEHDFTSYRAANCQSRTPMRHVHSVRVWRYHHLVIMDISANAFLHHMVRNIAGVLIDVGTGEKEVSWPADLLTLRDRTKGGKTAPASGLYLIGVTYDRASLPTSMSWPHFLVQPDTAVSS